MNHQRHMSRQDNKSSYFTPADSAVDKLVGKRVEYFTYVFEGTEKWLNGIVFR